MNDIITPNKTLMDEHGRPIAKPQTKSPEIPDLIHSIFTPQKDITAYELSLLLHYLMGGALTSGDWEMLGDATRHLSILPDSPVSPEGATIIKI